MKVKIIVDIKPEVLKEPAVLRAIWIVYFCFWVTLPSLYYIWRKLYKFRNLLTMKTEIYERLQKFPESYTPEPLLKAENVFTEVAVWWEAVSGWSTITIHRLMYQELSISGTQGWTQIPWLTELDKFCVSGRSAYFVKKW